MSQMAAGTKVWTLEELHSLPDDGNKYELIHGELFVTPAPTDQHETIAARLTRLLDPYVEANGLGFVYRPRSVFRFEGSEVEPDLMVRPVNSTTGKAWENAPTPRLIVEIASPGTARRDRTYKRELYLEGNVPEYWIVDPERQMMVVIRPNQSDVIVADSYLWHPAGVHDAFALRIADLF